LGSNKENLKQQLAVKAGEETQTGLTLKALIGNPDMKNRFEEMLGKKAAGFLSSVMSVVNSNTDLKQCDPRKVLACAAVAAALDLPINPNLGQAYIVPYRHKGVPQPQFQMGWRGFTQLGLRSNQYKSISNSEYYAGEIVYYNPITGEIEFDIERIKARDRIADKKIEGYIAYFKLLNGFEKFWPMTVEQVHDHGKRYSRSYNSDKGRWKLDFHSMALKTVIKQLLSKFGPLSVDMQLALTADQAVINALPESTGEIDLTYIDGADYIDAEAVTVTCTDNDEQIKPNPQPQNEFPEGSALADDFEKSMAEQSKADKKGKGGEQQSLTPDKF